MMEADQKCLGRSCGKYALLMAFGRDMSSILERGADTDARCEGSWSAVPTPMLGVKAV